MKNLLLILALFGLCLNLQAQETKNELSLSLVSAYASPKSKNAESSASNIYPITGIGYSRNLKKLSLFASYNRYASSGNYSNGFHMDLYLDDYSWSHKESSFELGISNKPNADKRFSPVASIAVISGVSYTKSYENFFIQEWSISANPSVKNIGYLGLNSAIGFRYNVSEAFHIDLTTNAGLVRTTGTLNVFNDQPMNPINISYRENATVPLFTFGEISLGVNF